jgi:hypothetical protein
MGIHTHCYNYLSAQSNSATGSNNNRLMRMKELYKKLDEHFAHAARELFMGAPASDNTALILYLNACFKRYSACAHSIRRLLNYLNEHYAVPAMKEGEGWFGDDGVDVDAKTGTEYFVTRKDPRMEELKRWGYTEGGPTKLLARAEACAEAASTLDRVVPLSSLLLRRFRTEFIEPLLQAPAVNGKDKNLNPAVTARTKIESRLAWAVNEMWGAKGGENLNGNQRLVLAELAVALRTVGVRANQPLRQQLDVFVRRTTYSPV